MSSRIIYLILIVILAFSGKDSVEVPEKISSSGGQMVTQPVLALMTIKTKGAENVPATYNFFKYADY